MGMGDIIARMGWDGKEFDKGFDKARKKVNTFATGELSQVKRALAGAFTVGAIAAFTAEAIKFGDDLDAMSKATGISAENLQKLDYAAKLNNTSIESVSGGLKKLSVTMMNALGGDKKALENFAALGITLDDLKTKSADQIFLKIADAVKGSNDPTATMANVMGVMGKSAGDLIPLLLNGSEGIKQFANEAAKAGVVISDSMVKTLSDTEQRLQKLKMQFRGLMAPIVGTGIKAVGFGADISSTAWKSAFALAKGDWKGAEQLWKDFAAGDAAKRSKRPSQADIAKFNREATDPAAESEAKRKAERIAKLREQVDSQAEDLGRKRLPLEEQIVDLMTKQLLLKEQLAIETDEEKRLNVQKDILDAQKEINSLRKQADQEGDRAMDQAGDQFTKFEEAKVAIKKIKAGEISVSAPITDSLARIGGFVGGTADNGIRIAERQLAVQEKLQETLENLRAELSTKQLGQLEVEF